MTQQCRSLCARSRINLKFVLSGLIYISIVNSSLAQRVVKRTDVFIENGSLKLQVRKISYHVSERYPILLIHGGTGATTSFDLSLPGASFAEALARKGFLVYLMNVRGWERSTAPAYQLSDTALTAGSHLEAAADIDAVVTYIVKNNHISKVSLFGWASGGHWASYYTTKHDEKIHRLVVLNSLYGVKAPWNFNGAFADPTDSSRFDASIPVYRQSTEQAVIAIWKTGVKPGAPAADSALIRAYAKSAVSFNTEHLLKVPGGFRKESFYMARGKKYWDARDLKVPTLIVRGEDDFWSRPIDVNTFYNDLTNASIRKKLTIPGATHFLFLDRRNGGQQILVAAIADFMKVRQR